MKAIFAEKVLLGLAVLWLAGCASQELGVHCSSPEMAEAGEMGEMAEGTLGTPVGSYLYRDRVPQPGFGAYGYLIFTSRPTDETLKRYELVCQSYHINLENLYSYDYADNRRHYMVTYWFLNRDKGTEGAPTSYSEWDCKRLVEEYDYARAYKVTAAESRLSVPGPILVAWKKPYEADPTPKDSLILDMSDFAEEDLDRALRIWRSNIVKDPDIWGGVVFNVVKFREAFRSLIKKYGEHIVTVLRG